MLKTCGILLLCTNYLQMTFSELELDRRWQKRGIMFKSGINIPISMQSVEVEWTKWMFHFFGLLKCLCLWCASVLLLCGEGIVSKYMWAICGTFTAVLSIWHPTYSVTHHSNKPNTCLLYLHLTGPEPSWYTRWKKRVFVLKGTILILHHIFQLIICLLSSLHLWTMPNI